MKIDINTEHSIPNIRPSPHRFKDNHKNPKNSISANFQDGILRTQKQPLRHPLRKSVYLVQRPEFQYR